MKSIQQIEHTRERANFHNSSEEFSYQQQQQQQQNHQHLKPKAEQPVNRCVRNAMGFLGFCGPSGSTFWD